MNAIDTAQKHRGKKQNHPVFIYNEKIDILFEIIWVT